MLLSVAQTAAEQPDQGVNSLQIFTQFVTEKTPAQLANHGDKDYG